MKIISNLATVFGIASMIFAVISAFLTLKLLQIVSPLAPTSYVQFEILSAMLPYLFLAVVSLATAFISMRSGKESSKKEALPQEAQLSEKIA